MRPDSDGDGIGDAWEMKHFNNLVTAGANTNADADTLSDRAEYEAGTNPHNAASYFRIISCSFGEEGAVANLTFTSSPGRLYRLEHSTTLAPPWSASPAGYISPDAGASTTRELALPGGAQQFLRVTTALPLSP